MPAPTTAPAKARTGSSSAERPTRAARASANPRIVAARSSSMRARSSGTDRISSARSRSRATCSGDSEPKTAGIEARIAWIGLNSAGCSSKAANMSGSRASWMTTSSLVGK